MKLEKTSRKMVNREIRVGLKRDVDFNPPQDLARLNFETMIAEERRRHSVSDEIHDEIVKDLVFCNLKLGMLAKIEKTENGSLEEVQLYVRELIEKVRRLMNDISSPLLYDLGIEVAVRQFLKEVQRKYGIAYYFEENGPSKVLEKDMRIFLFLAVRELTMNAVQHARARTVRVQLARKEATFDISIEDDGCGFDVFQIFDNPLRPHGTGLMNIYERLRHIGGYLDVQSEPNNGTKICLVAPLKNGLHL